MNKFQELDAVKMASDKYEKQGVPRGKVGAVLSADVEGYYLVEFSNSTTGETILLDSFREDELAPCD